MNTVIAKLSSIVQELKRRVLLLISIGKVHRIDDSKDLQQLQIEAMPGEMHDSAIKFGHYGLATNPRVSKTPNLACPLFGLNYPVPAILNFLQRRFKAAIYV